MNIRAIVLQLIGGSPLNKVRAVLTNGLPSPNIADLPGLGDLLGSVLQGGAGAVLQNPLGAALGSVQGGIAAVAGSLDASVASALTGSGGLMDSLSSLQGATDLLSGVASAGDGAFGLLDVMSHAATLDGLGDAPIPAGLGMDSVLAPINLLGTVQTDMAQFVGQLPSLSPATALAQISAFKTQISGALSASTNAMATVQNAAQAMAGVSSVASALVAGPASLQGFLGSVVQPSAMGAMQAAVNAHAETLFGPPTDLAESGVL